MNTLMYRKTSALRKGFAADVACRRSALGEMDQLVSVEMTRVHERFVARRADVRPLPAVTQ